MKRSIFIFLLLTLIAILIPTYAFSQDLPTLSCLFTEFICVKYNNHEIADKIEAQQSMRIVKGKTDTETLKLDGSHRATNSTEWKLITKLGWETWEIQFIGNFGDMLSLKPMIDDLGANNRPLHGWYIASLVSSTTITTSILIGTCFVE